MNRRELIVKSVMGVAAVALGAPLFVGYGCAAGALPFITMGLNLIGTILPTIPSIISAISGLAGHNILSSAQVAKLTQVFVGIQDLFRQAENALTLYQSNNDPTLITKIQDILNQVKNSLSSVLSDVQITDPATVTKLTGIVNSFIDLADNILLILPSVINGKVVARKPSHAQLQQVTPEAWAARFNRTVSAPSGSSQVDGIFADVKAVPKNSK